MTGPTDCRHRNAGCSATSFSPAKTGATSTATSGHGATSTPDRHLDDQLGALNEDGLIVYVGARDLTLTGGERDMPWREAVVKVLHEDDARDTAETQTPAAAAT